MLTCYTFGVVITVAAYKGGVGKTTTAVHVADALAAKAPTLLIDRERFGGSFRWYENGSDWRFDAVRGRDATPELIAAYRTGHIVIDTPAAPTADELEAFASRSDLVIVPTTPDALALELLTEAVRDLRRFKAPYRVLLTIVPPLPSREAEKARRALERAQVPLFKTSIGRGAAFQQAALRSTLVGNVRAHRSREHADAYAAVAEELKEVMK